MAVGESIPPKEYVMRYMNAGAPYNNQQWYFVHIRMTYRSVESAASIYGHSALCVATFSSASWRVAQ